MTFNQWLAVEIGRAFARRREWRINPWERQTSPEAKVAVAMLIGEMHYLWDAERRLRGGGR